MECFLKNQIHFLINLKKALHFSVHHFDKQY